MTVFALLLTCLLPVCTPPVCTLPACASAAGALVSSALPSSSSGPLRTSLTPSDTWRWPLGPPVPQVVRAFSPPPLPWGPGHRGVDLAARPGQPVYSAGPGRVSYSGWLAGRGIVAVTHGALRTTYLPVRPDVRVGHAVRAGTRIGTVEGSGHCPAPCLHWGLLQGASYLDPLSLVRPEVRLLPHWRPSPSPTPDPLSRDTLSPDTPSRDTPSRPSAEKTRPVSSGTEIGLRDATTAGSGALAGMLVAFALTSLWRHGRTRRPLPPGVIDLAKERRERRERRLRGAR